MEDLQYTVMEHFHTLQGEGFHTGRSAYFIRLSGCDIGCVWCDVKESWDADNGEKYTVNKLLALTAQNDFIVLTGGEPAMHDLNPITQALKKQQKTIAIETSGCYPLKGEIDWYTFSPKKFKAPIQEAFDLANELKVVIYHPSDFDWATKHAEKVNKNCMLYLQPEWSKLETLGPDIIAFVKSNPAWRLSLQTHKYLNIP
jgi:organic radical activating enzyme